MKKLALKLTIFLLVQNLFAIELIQINNQTNTAVNKINKEIKQVNSINKKINQAKQIIQNPQKQLEQIAQEKAQEYYNQYQKKLKEQLKNQIG